MASLQWQTATSKHAQKPGMLSTRMESVSKTHVLKQVREDGLKLGKFYEFQNQQEVVLAAVAQNGLALCHASDGLKKNREVVLAALGQTASALQYADAELQKDRDVVLMAVAQDALALEHAAIQLRRDRNTVLAAVGQNGLALKFVAAELRADQQIVCVALQNNVLAFEFVSDELQPCQELEDLLQDWHVVLHAAQVKAWLFKFAHAQLRRNRDFVISALGENGLVLQYVAHEFQHDQELVRIAVQNNGLALEFAGDEVLRDRDLIMLAIQGNAHALKFASGSCRHDHEIVLAAVQKDHRAFLYASAEIQADCEIALAAVMEDGHGPNSLRNDRKVILCSLQADGLALQYASDDLRHDIDLALAAVKQNGLALQFVLHEGRSLLEEDPRCLAENDLFTLVDLDVKASDIPEIFSIVLAAVRQNGTAIQYARSDHRVDPEVVRLAMRMLAFCSLSGEQLQLSLKPEDIMSEVKSVVAQHLGIACDSVRLILDTQEVLDTETRTIREMCEASLQRGDWGLVQVIKVLPQDVRPEEFPAASSSVKGASVERGNLSSYLILRAFGMSTSLPPGYSDGHGVLGHEATGVTIKCPPLQISMDTDCIILYHYTGEIGFNAICGNKNMKHLRASYGLRAHFGDGIYASARAPDEFRSVEEILRNNYSNTPDLGKQLQQIAQWHGMADYCVPIMVPHTLAVDVKSQKTIEMRSPGYTVRHNEPIRPDRDIWVIAIRNQCDDVAQHASEHHEVIYRHLQDQNWTARLDAVEILAGSAASGDQRATAAVVQALTDEDPNVRIAAIWAVACARSISVEEAATKIKCFEDSKSCAVKTNAHDALTFLWGTSLNRFGPMSS